MSEGVRGKLVRAQKSDGRFVLPNVLSLFVHTVRADDPSATKPQGRAGRFIVGTDRTLITKGLSV